MSLHGIDTTGDALLYQLFTDCCIGGPLASEDPIELYSFLRGGRSYFGEKVLYVWWQYGVDEHVLFIDDDEFTSDNEFIKEDMLDWDASSIRSAIPVMHPVLTRVEYDYGQDYFGEHWDYIDKINLYTFEESGIHYFPIAVSLPTTAKTMRISYVQRHTEDQCPA